MKGYKGFKKGMVYRGKQYAENTTFEEQGNKSATNKSHIGAKLSIASFIKALVDFTFSKIDFKNAKSTNTGDRSAATNTGNWSVAKNTGYRSATTNTGDYSATTNTGCRSAATNTGNWSVAKNTGYRSAATNTGNCSTAANTGNCSAATNTDDYSAATNTGNCSAATNTGDYSAAANTGNCSAATNTGNWSVAEVSGNDSFAICTGINGKAKGKLGCYIALAEYGVDKGHYHLRFFKTHKVDNETIKADTWYTLKNGEFCVAE